MNIQNKPASFFAILILILITYILYWGRTPSVSVIIQAGKETSISSKKGISSNLSREKEWTVRVADMVAKQLRVWQIEVKRVPAKVPLMRANIAVAIHFDGAKVSCTSGASIGYPNQNSHDFAQRWRKLYAQYFPFKWQDDNFTKNLSQYYGYKWIRANKFLVLELGEITCKKQSLWLKPKLKNVSYLIAYSIATELGVDAPKPSFLEE